MLVILASANPVKIGAARSAFGRVFPDRSLEIRSVSVSSGVADQPRSDAETLRGAENRVAHAAELRPQADFWVGLEGGIAEVGESMDAFAWVVVRSGRRLGRSRTATFQLPPPVVELVRGGKELGEADDIVFGRSNSKHREGAVGLLTEGLIDRQGLYEPAVVLALVPFAQPELYRAG